MRFSPYVQKCLRELEKAGEYATDAYLVHFVKMQHLSERITQLDGRCDLEMESDSIPKAPVSGYIFALQGELESLRKSMPQSLNSNSTVLPEPIYPLVGPILTLSNLELIELQMNTICLRLHETPRIDASLLASLSKSFTTPTSLSSASSPLDSFYRSHSALKTWLNNFLEAPISAFYCVPLPISINMIYAVIILSRWARLFGPGTQLPKTPQPPDPSGTYNNPARDPLTPESSAPNGSPSRTDTDNLAHALATLKIQLATQPGLALDINGIMTALADKLDQAGAMLAARSATPQAREGNMWILKAAKLRIAQFKLQQWAEVAAEKGNSDGEEEDSDDDADDTEASGENGAPVTNTDAHTMGSPDDQMMDLAFPTTGDLFEGMDSFMWTDGWDDWGLSFDLTWPLPQYSDSR